MSQPSNQNPATESETDLSATDRHRLLASQRRRIVLDVVGARTAPVGLDELAAAVATREADGDAVDGETLDRVRGSLYHCHLPMLADLAVVVYDVEAQRVAAVDCNVEC